jgi:hypothetical protein
MGKEKGERRKGKGERGKEKEERPCGVLSSV